MIYDTLTKRQKEVINYVIYGYSNDEIARLLHLSFGRVSTIIYTLYTKYNVYENDKRCRLMRKRLEELGIDFNKLTAKTAVF